LHSKDKIFITGCVPNLRCKDREANSVKSNSSTFQLRRGINPITEMFWYFLNARVWANARNPLISSETLQTMNPLIINTT